MRSARGRLIAVREARALSELPLDRLRAQPRESTLPVVSTGRREYRVDRWVDASEIDEHPDNPLFAGVRVRGSGLERFRAYSENFTVDSAGTVHDLRPPLSLLGEIRLTATHSLAGLLLVVVLIPVLIILVPVVLIGALFMGDEDG